MLTLGWSHKLPALVQELADSRSGGVEITIMSRLSLSERESDLSRLGADRDRVQILHVEGDDSVERHLVAVDPGRFEHVLPLAPDQADDAGLRSGPETSGPEPGPCACPPCGGPLP